MNSQTPPRRDGAGRDPHELAAAYALDAVDETERREFERHLAGCPTCREEVAGLQEVGTSLSGLAEITPPAQLRSRVLGSIAGVPQVGPDASDDLAARRAVRSRSKMVTWAAAAVAAAVLVVGAVSWHPWTQDQSTVQLTATQQVLQAKDAQRYVQQVDGATATVVRSSSQRKAVLLTTDLAPAPKGHVYELWYFDSAGKPVRAGLMPRGSSRDATVLLEGDAATARGVGITVEPAGGSEQPTTAPVVSVDFS